MARAQRLRLLLLGAAICLFAGLLILRLVDLQIRRGEEFGLRAREHREQVRRLMPRRGDLLDRHDQELAVTVASHAVLARRRQISDPAATARRLAPLLDLPARDIEKKLREGGTPVHLAYRISPARAVEIENARIPGISLEPTARRVYPNRTLAAHALGYVSVDNQPLGGIELAFDEAVHGTDGRAVDLTDATGAIFDSRVISEAIPGLSLRLTLDLTVQHVLEEELQNAILSARGRAGAAAALDPATGEILAVASWPTFNPNTFNLASAEEKQDRVVVSAYEPGSTFKVIIAAAGLENHLVRPEEVFFCGNGRFQIGRFTIRDHKSFGDLTFTQVLAESSNVGAMKAGMRLSPQIFHDTIRRFGFGEKTGLGLPGESPGRLRPPAQWSLLSQPSLAIGQEVLATPLQVLSAIAAVGNRGLLVRPWLARALIDHEGRVLRQFEPPAPRRVISEETARTLASMLEHVILDGTGKAAAVPGYSVGGKTGTAQKSGQKGEGYLPGKYVSSFVGWAPLWEPRLAAIFVVDEPQTLLFHGGDVAAPAFGRFAARVLPVLGVPPESGRDPQGGPDRLVVRRTSTEPDPAARWVMLHRTTWNAHAEDNPDRGRDHRKVRGPGSTGSDRSRNDSGSARPSVGGSAAGQDSPRETGTDPTALMPDLTGLTSREAVARLTSLGLLPRFQGLGRVTAQEPSPGAPLPKGGEECRLWLGTIQ